MKTVWGALIWKEWREHKWKLVALTAVLLGLPTATMLVDEPGAIYTGSMISIYFALPVLILFVSASAAAGETSQRTMPFLQSQPIPTYHFGVVKLIFALLTVCIPILTLFLYIALCEKVIHTLFSGYPLEFEQGRTLFANNTGSWFLPIVMTSIVGAGSLTIWIAAAGVNLSDEVRAGAIGILVIVGYAALLTLVGRWLSPLDEFFTWFKALAAIGPGGPLVLMLLEGIRHIDAFRLLDSWPLLVVSSVVHFGLACSFVARFGRVPTRLRPSEKMIPVPRGDWLAPPQRSKFQALVWKQFRESGPLAMFGMAAILALSLLFAMGELSYSTAQSWLKGAVFTWGGLGFFLAIVAGIGVFFEEYRPGIEGFWGSLPIHRDAWFCVKFGFGICFTLLALLLPFAVVLPVAYFADVRLSGPDHTLEGGIAVFALQAAVFSAAALAMVVVRQAIYAAVFAVAFVVIVPIGAEYFRFIDEREIAIGFSAAGLLATLLAWLAVRYDWSLRR